MKHGSISEERDQADHIIEEFSQFLDKNPVKDEYPELMDELLGVGRYYPPVPRIVSRAVKPPKDGIEYLILKYKELAENASRLIYDAQSEVYELRDQIGIKNRPLHNKLQICNIEELEKQAREYNAQNAETPPNQNISGPMLNLKKLMNVTCKDPLTAKIHKLKDLEGIQSIPWNALSKDVIREILNLRDTELYLTLILMTLKFDSKIKVNKALINLLKAQAGKSKDLFNQLPV